MTEIRVRDEPNRSPIISRQAVEALRDYARELEEELDGPEAGEGEAIVRINALLADADSEIMLAELDLGGTCDDTTEIPGGPHVSSPSLCVFCLEYW